MTATYPLIDIGVNLTDGAFAQDQQSVIKNAQNAGLIGLIAIGTDIDESQQALELSQQHPDFIFCTAGVHPHYAKDTPSDWQRTLTDLLAEQQVKAIGETGLDFNRNFSPPERQVKVFEQQLEIAAACGKPVYMHQRDAHKTFRDMLRYYRDDLKRCVIHCFTDQREELYDYLDLDLYIGITGWLCDERRGTHLLSLIKDIPLNRLMLETDSPYLLPRTLSSKPKNRRNEPAFLTAVCELAAQQLGMDPATLAQQTSKNAIDFFELPIVAKDGDMEL